MQIRIRRSNGGETSRIPRAEKQEMKTMFGYIGCGQDWSRRENEKEKRADKRQLLYLHVLNGNFMLARTKHKTTRKPRHQDGSRGKREDSREDKQIDS